VLCFGFQNTNRVMGRDPAQSAVSFGGWKLSFLELHKAGLRAILTP